MSGNYSALSTLWASLPSSFTTAQKLAAVNATLVAGPAVDVQRASIKAILFSAGAYASMQAYVANPSGANQSALIACNYLLAIVDYEPTAIGPTLATSQEINQALITSLSAGFTADPNTGVTAAVLAQLMALINPRVPWWQMNGFSQPVNVADLANAGNLF
jgi:hypothetical protein